MKKQNVSWYLWCVVMAVLLALLLRETWDIVVNHIVVPDWKQFKWSLLSWPNVFKNFNLGLYWWFAVGVLLFLVVRKFLVPRSRFFTGAFNGMETRVHEFSHELMCFLTGRRVLSKHVEENTGEVISSGPEWGAPLVSLSPYTFPYITYVGLALRMMIEWKSTWLFDILVGMTLGFHVWCFARETRLFQSDINRFSTLWFPGLYIAMCMVFNFNVFAVSFWSSKNLFTAIWWVIQHLFVW